MVSEEKLHKLFKTADVNSKSFVCFCILGIKGNTISCLFPCKRCLSLHCWTRLFASMPPSQLFEHTISTVFTFYTKCMKEDNMLLTEQLSHLHLVFTVELRGSAVHYLVLGFTQLVLQFREAEASHGDEVPDHSHKLIPTFPRSALLVVQLLKGDKIQMCEFRNR